MNWDQLKTVLWLRWRLTQNQWNRNGNIGAVVSAVVLAAGIACAVLLGIGAFIAGIYAFDTASAWAVMFTWDGVVGFFLFSWTIGLLTELQRSETIDLEKLMHLPVALGQVFTINYIASHATFSLIVCVPVMLGLSAGLAISRTPAMLLLIPAALAMVFMITAWTYCLRGWLSALMTNPRRRRTVIATITVAVVLIGQAPNLYFNVFARESFRSKSHAKGQQKAEFLGKMETVHKLVPPLWVPLAARMAIEKNVSPALLGTLGFVVIGALGLRRAYSSTVRFYQGGARRAAKPAKLIPAGPHRPVSRKRLLVERRIPKVPDGAAAVALASFQSLSRAPEVKMQWLMAIIMTLVFGGMTIFRGSSQISAPIKPFVATGLVSMSLFMLIQSMGNAFGFDRAGFRAFVLAPISRRDILLGKNLSNLPIIAAIAVAVIALTVARLGIPLLSTLAIVMQAMMLFLLVCIVGNALSIHVPYRVRAGSMKPTKLPTKARIVMIVTHMLFPLAMAPAFVPTVAQLLWDYGELPKFPINVLLSAILLAGIAFGYWKSLDPLARMLQEREQKILEVLASDVE